MTHEAHDERTPERPFTHTELKVVTIAILQAVDTFKPKKREKVLEKILDASGQLLSLAATPIIHRKLPEGSSAIRAKIVVQESRALCEAVTLIRAAVTEARGLRGYKTGRA